VELRTDRLLMRRWRDADRAPFAALNADPEVMEHFPSTLTRAESNAMIDRIEGGFGLHGYGLWAVETLAEGIFIGFVGLNWVPFTAHFTPALEVGWRLARPAWGHGYATEAATAARDFAFGTAEVDELTSFTTARNERSQAVMRRIGLRHDPADDFDHPNLPVGHPMRRHVLYRMPSSRWQAIASPAGRGASHWVDDELRAAGGVRRLRPPPPGSAPP
jgi:RimJ/RimL family protein N-acetyltransferase